MTKLSFTQIRKLATLRKRYAHEVAVAKQEGSKFKTETEELEVLALIDLSRQFRTAIEEYTEIVDIEDINHFIMLGTICNESVGKIAKNLEVLHSKDDIDKALSIIDSNRERFRS